MEKGLKQLQQKLENELNALRKIRTDISKSVQISRQYAAQHSENEMVLKELDILEDDATVYKLIGPVLVKQDLIEAKANVTKRIEYISSEMKRLEITIKSCEQKEASKQEDVIKVQQQLQAVKASQ